MTELGTCVHLRDVVTIDIGDVTAPEPVEPGDLVASVDELYRVEAVLAPAPGARAVPELARVVELAPA